MKVFIIIFALILSTLGCQTTSSKENYAPINQTAVTSTPSKTEPIQTSIRDIDFFNFTFPWTKSFGEKTFTLKNGISELPDERKLSLESLSYIDDK